MVRTTDGTIQNLVSGISVSCPGNIAPCPKRLARYRKFELGKRISLTPNDIVYDKQGKNAKGQ